MNSKDNQKTGWKQYRHIKVLRHCRLSIVTCNYKMSNSSHLGRCTLAQLGPPYKWDVAVSLRELASITVAHLAGYTTTEHNITEYDNKANKLRTTQQAMQRKMVDVTETGAKRVD